jgi:hypothetical protein
MAMNRTESVNVLGILGGYAVQWATENVSPKAAEGLGTFLNEVMAQAKANGEEDGSGEQ